MALLILEQVTRSFYGVHALNGRAIAYEQDTFFFPPPRWEGVPRLSKGCQIVLWHMSF